MRGRELERARAARAAALGAVALAVLLLLACPAFAGRQKIVRGATTLTVPAGRVAALTAADVLVIDEPPLSFSFVWDGDVSWRYRTPMAAGGSFDAAAKKGTLVHAGGLRFVNVATGASLPLRGLRASVDGPSHVILQAAVGGPPVTRAAVMVSTGGGQLVKKGKRVSIGGLQFRLTPQLVIALQTALVGTFDATSVFAAGEVSFRLK